MAGLGVGPRIPSRFRLSRVIRSCLIGPMTQDDVLDHFRASGALLEGHFILRSGLRSRQFFQCALAFQEMPAVERLGMALADKLRGLGAATVLAPAMGGLVIGQEAARQLGLRFIFAEKVDDRLALRRGFKLEPGERVLVVEDVITQGGRAREALDIVREHGGEVAGVGVVIDRSNGVFDPGVPLERLVAVDVETYDAANLPSDLAAIEAVKPGS